MPKLQLLLLPSLFLLSALSSFAGERADISISKFAFHPAHLEVKAGTVVRWTNDEKRQYHSIWFKAAGEEPSAYFFPGEQYEKRFDQVGEFPYTCEPHPEMAGTITVVE